MPTTEDKLVQYLIEARAMELALVRTLQAHIAVTPSGDYRSELERHLRETHDHADGIGRRLADLDHGPTVVGAVYDVGQRLAGQLLAFGKTPLDLLRGASPEEKLLKNAKDEAATEALEIATYDAIEQLALLAGDELTARLAASHRADEERMLAALRAQIPALTAAVVDSEVAGRPSYDVARTGAAQAARRATRDLTEEREEQRRPFAGYDELTVEQVARRLGQLTPAQLRHVETYERAHKQRRTVLDAVEHERERERERQHAGAGSGAGTR